MQLLPVVLDSYHLACCFTIHQPNPVFRCIYSNLLNFATTVLRLLFKLLKFSLTLNSFRKSFSLFCLVKLEVQAENSCCSRWLKIHSCPHLAHYSTLTLVFVTPNADRRKFKLSQFLQKLSTPSHLYLSTFYRHHITLSFPFHNSHFLYITVLLSGSISSPVI